jgi:hypothetical protein
VFQRGRIGRLAERGALRSGIGAQEARDLMWRLTGRDVYRMLTAEREWSSTNYEMWLADTPRRICEPVVDHDSAAITMRI